MVEDGCGDVVEGELPGTEVDGVEVVDAADGSTGAVVLGTEFTEPATVVVVSITEPVTASAFGVPRGVGASVTWDRTLAMPAAAIAIASTVAPIHAATMPIDCFMPPVSPRTVGTALTHG